jgi:carboxyl-terminal processing protease
VNSGSASGSEIVSAALQDHHRAFVIGERSFGKGSVQNIKEFGEGEIKLTTATFWRPSGKNLNKSSTAGKEEDTWGVKPNLEVKLPRKERDDLFDHMRDTEIIEPEGGRPNKEAKAPFVDRQLEDALKYIRAQIGRASR